MKKLLYACGDSWTAGEEIPATSPTGDVDRYYNTWPWFLCQELDIPMCINEGAGGGSNLRIFRKTNDFILGWIGKGKSVNDLMIVIGWTIPERTEVFYKGNYNKITPHAILGPAAGDPVLEGFKDMYYSTCDIDNTFAETLRYMLNLRMLCSSFGIAYYDFIAIGPRPFRFKKEAYTNFNLQLENLYSRGTWTDHINTHNHTRYPKLHPTIESHKLWAVELAKAIK